MEKKKGLKKSPNKILYTIFMLVLFVFIQEVIIWGYGSNTILDAIMNYPQGNLVIGEAILAGLCLIVMLLFGNSYVFTEKKEKLSKGLFYGLFYIIGALFFMTVFKEGFGQHKALLNLLIGCFFIGVCEEFLCRGFLLNEFLERFGKDTKGVWYSIIVSGVVFGLMHLGNIFVGQPIIQTIAQSIAAGATGIVFGVIYYKTRNIWSVIILHALWDFSLFLGQIIPQVESIELISKISVLSIAITILGSFVELLLLIPFKKIKEKPDESKIVVCSVISVLLLIVTTGLQGSISYKLGKKYKYDKMEIKNYMLITNNILNYKIKEPELLMSLEADDDNNLILKNIRNNYFVKIECENLIDYQITELEDSYIISYVDYKDRTNSYFYYKEIKKNNLQNTIEFMDSLKENYNKYLLPERLGLLDIYDYDNEKKYVALYDKDYGYYVLNNNKLALLKI